MKQVILSDHVSDQIKAAKNERLAAHETAMQAYYAAEARYRDVAALRRKRLADAWKQGRTLAVIGALLSMFVGFFSVRPSKPVYRESRSQREQIWRSGEQGERMVVEFFGHHLSDEWTMLSGYHNPRGEIDQILVGPSGVFAIEIKNINGVIHCDGDEWWRDRYDRYGNQVESGAYIRDRGGRSPSQQLNDPANRLLFQLTKRTGVEYIYRVVMLTHQRARIGSMTNLTINMVSVLPGNQPDEMIQISDVSLTPEEVVNVVSVIGDDHSFHRRSRNRRRSASGKR